jgi:hypothetical protein
MYQINYLKYLIVLILALGYFIIFPEIGHTQSPSLSSQNINNNLNQIKTWVFFSYLISLAAIGISLYQLLWTKNQARKVYQDKTTEIQPSQLKILQHEVQKLTDSQENFITRQELEEFKSRLSNLNTEIKTLKNKNSGSLEQLELSEIELVEIYNNNSDSLSAGVIDVSESQESITERQRINTEQVFLEKVRKGRGSYWILASKQEYYVFPKPDKKINEFNYKYIISLFVLKNYKLGQSETFYLTEPGKLSLVKENTWKLIKKGKLEFE